MQTNLRLLDIVVSTSLLIFALPVICVCILLIRLGSSGPGLFRQTRVGRGEQTFTCYKLRTMKLGTVSAASHEVHSSSITSIGRFLRACKLDELPQLVNVLGGSMSLVGPRPCLPTQIELMEARRRLNVFSVRPGVTGVAQVQGVDMSDPERLALLDAQWVDRASVREYIALVIQTGLGRGRGDKVRQHAEEGQS